jgi:hypothetical protein
LGNEKLEVSNNAVRSLLVSFSGVSFCGGKKMGGVQNAARRHKMFIFLGIKESMNRVAPNKYPSQADSAAAVIGQVVSRFPARSSNVLSEFPVFG